MGLRLRNGAIFLHIPKTGGTFVEYILRNENLIEGSAGAKHADLYRSLYPMNYRSQIRRVISEAPYRIKNFLRTEVFGGHKIEVNSTQEPREHLPYLFCFVRHPAQWIESYYRFTSQQGWPDWSNEYDYYEFWHPNAMLNDLRSDTFNKFIEKVLKKRPGYVTEMFGWYTTPGVAFVGKTETLRKDLEKVLNELGMSYDRKQIFNTSPQNVSRKTNHLRWDHELKREFLKAEYAGLVRFGYLDDAQTR